MIRGLVHLYTGDGKGKTTAALGMAFRAWGHGMRVLMIQFLKSGRVQTGERLAAGRIGDGFLIETMGEGFVFEESDTSRHHETAQQAYRAAREALIAAKYDMVILDEVTWAIKCGLVSEEQILTLLESRPPGVHLVLTGRDAPPSLIERADIVTEMRDIKHHYRAGVEAQKGIEY
ncbi:MAG: cob(I)yrinic acid a,c-diamide adenosyltransferase [Bacillota bacterium]